MASSNAERIYRSKTHNYDDVVERVADHLHLGDPSKIRLTPHNCYSQQPKPQPIKYRGVERLADMLIHYNQVFSSISFGSYYYCVHILLLIVKGAKIFFTHNAN